MRLWVCVLLCAVGGTASAQSTEEEASTESMESTGNGSVWAQRTAALRELRRAGPRLRLCGARGACPAALAARGWVLARTPCAAALARPLVVAKESPALPCARALQFEEAESASVWEWESVFVRRVQRDFAVERHGMTLLALDSPFPSLEPPPPTSPLAQRVALWIEEITEYMEKYPEPDHEYYEFGFDGNRMMKIFLFAVVIPIILNFSVFIYVMNYTCQSGPSTQSDIPHELLKEDETLSVVDAESTSLENADVVKEIVVRNWEA